MLKNVTRRLRWLIEDVYDLVMTTYEMYPARAISVAASVVVFVAASQGIVIEEQDVLPALAIVLPILLGGNAIHNRVTPV